MLVYDIIKNCDIAQAIRIYLNDWADENELMERDKTIAAIYYFWKTICELSPNPSSEDILMASPCYENGKISTVAYLYEKDNFEESLRIIHEKEFPSYSPEDSLEMLEHIDVSGCFPVSYDYEWSPWEDILGFTVFKENIDRNGADAVAAYIFYEMTFDGWIKEERDARIEGIAGTISDTIKELEEKFTAEVCENVQKEKKTDAQDADDQKSMKIDILRDEEMIFKELKMICQDRDLHTLSADGLRHSDPYDFLSFIDSADIREYNRDTYFTPAEWAVLVSKSFGRTVEEKIEALQYLADHYTAAEFKAETVHADSYALGYSESFLDVVIETIRAWKEALAARFETEGTIFMAGLFEQEYSMQEDDWQYFSGFETAWTYLLQAKQEYLEDEQLKNVKTYAWIKRIRLDHGDRSVGESYLFDHEMRMVDVGIDEEKFFAGKEKIALAYDYLVYVPLPFEEGDIVRVDFPHMAVHYGVFSCEWKKPEVPQQIRMWVSLDIYREEDRDFDYTDNCPYYDWILGFSRCPDEELPKSEQTLKLIRAVRKGKLDFYMLLHKFGRNRLDELLKLV